jgi:hypothetical protein
MTEGAILAKRCTDVFLNGTWVANTNYFNELTGLSVAKANATIGQHNTIALLAQHINYYVNGLNQVFAGLPLTISDKHSYSFNPITTQQHWDDFLAIFFANAEQFATHIAAMPNEKLAGPFIQPVYGTYLANINAALEHAYYHLGQIVLLKKLLP